jgi:hypothetical protein
VGEGKKEDVSATLALAARARYIHLEFPDMPCGGAFARAGGFGPDLAGVSDVQ